MTIGDTPAELRVVAHYVTENLEERILSAFEASGKLRDSITLAMAKTGLRRGVIAPVEIVARS